MNEAAGKTPARDELVNSGTTVQRADAHGITAIWGDASLGKRLLREESLRKHLALPLGERLRIGLSMGPAARGDERRR